LLRILWQENYTSDGKLVGRVYVSPSQSQLWLNMPKLNSTVHHLDDTGSTMPKAIKPSDLEVTIERRRQERRSDAQADCDSGPVSEFKPARRRKDRRRQIDPTTCERDYNNDEIDFMQALDAYKRSSGRMFPTCSEILEVIRGLGYVKLSPEDQQVLASIEAVEAELAESAAD